MQLHSRGDPERVGKGVIPLDRMLDWFIFAFLFKVAFKGDIFLFLSLPQHYNREMSQILGSNRFSPSDVAVHTFLPEMT